MARVERNIHEPLLMVGGPEHGCVSNIQFTGTRIAIPVRHSPEFDTKRLFSETDPSEPVKRPKFGHIYRVEFAGDRYVLLYEETQ